MYDNLHEYRIDLQIMDGDMLGSYTQQINNLNAQTNKYTKDSGFDLYIPSMCDIHSGYTKLIDLGIKCAVYRISPKRNLSDEDGHCTLTFNELEIPSPYYIYPRSSIYKTKLRLANNVGIIDNGYRGNLKIALDNIGNKSEHIYAGHRLVQLCMPDLSPNFTVNIVNSLDKTIRGNGGFGSTGK